MIFNNNYPSAQAGVSPVCNNQVLHTVVRGDTLYSLANYYDTTVRSIMSLNNRINPYNLQIGSQITICAGPGYVGTPITPTNPIPPIGTIPPSTPITPPTTPTPPIGTIPPSTPITPPTTPTPPIGTIPTNPIPPIVTLPDCEDRFNTVYNEWSNFMNCVNRMNDVFNENYMGSISSSVSESV